MFWEHILAEVLNKKNKKYKKYAPFKCRTRLKSSRIIKTYYLGEKLQNLYLTKREAECMFLLLKGKSINTIAAILKLSPRTIEYYLKNIKIKLNCRTKFDLIELILHSDFYQNIDFEF
jgi:DNA-binding CsgD family transcriptional regulator